jgi:PBP1b-binding outer membrane lipoprotein LpoB
MVLKTSKSIRPKGVASILLFVVFFSCNVRNPQAVFLKNSSDENIYFILSTDSLNPTEKEISVIRPASYLGYEEIADEQFRGLYQHLIPKGAVLPIVTSESSEVFVNSVSIQSIIKNRYQGKLSVFVLSEKDLAANSDQEIIEKQLAQKTLTLKIDDILEDTVLFVYGPR